MSRPRVVYDTMVFVQWALLKSQCSHGTLAALEQGRVELCIGESQMTELGRVLRYPELAAKSPHLSEHAVQELIEAIARSSTWVAQVNDVFKHAGHPKDDHIFNLAISARANFLVTWEVRHLEMQRRYPNDSARLVSVAPLLRVIDPPAFLRMLNETHPQ